MLLLFLLLGSRLGDLFDNDLINFLELLVVDDQSLEIDVVL